MSVKTQAELLDERDFLVDSLQRLEQERAAGIVDEDEFVALREQQIARTAAVLRDLEIVYEHPVPPTSAKVRSPRQRRRLLTIAAVVAFVVVAAGGLALSASGRSGDAELTGSVAPDSNTLIARAQQQTATGRPAEAVKTYDEVLQRDPKNPTALTYKGWLVRLAGLPNQGLQSIDAAIAANPTYPDAHFFRGFIYLRDRQDPQTAIAEFETFLANNPPQEMIGLVQQALADARAQAAAPSSAG